MEKQLKAAATWFEIPCADLDRAQRFYETILGCSMKKDDSATQATSCASSL